MDDTVVIYFGSLDLGNYCFAVWIRISQVKWDSRIFFIFFLLRRRQNFSLLSYYVNMYYIDR